MDLKRHLLEVDKLVCLYGHTRHIRHTTVLCPSFLDTHRHRVRHTLEAS